tara:strand:+ start:139 stop:669 length:531 start_codon:yes stop_codon:yes gene_type:complete
MATAGSYPVGTPKDGDYILGTSIPLPDEVGKKPQTMNFSIGSVVTFATQDYVEVTKSISNSEWLALKTTSIEIVPAQGAGTVVQVLTAHVKWDHSGADFSFNQPLTLGNGTTGVAGVATQGTLPTTYSAVDADSTQIFTISGADASLNSPINFGCASSATLAGGGTLQVTVRYQVI